MAYSYIERQKNIDRLKNESFDLLIIGGGISGAGVARDAASRGMKVALVEASDFSSGTSSRSSKLVHGGIRYLENYEFGLVFEALRERRNLFDMAPHLVHPLRFMLPIYKGGRVGMFKLGLGMWLYDALSLFEAPRMHERLSREETLKRAPMLQAEDLLGSYVYSDAYMDDDRLVLETLRSAHTQGAVTANFIRATGGEIENSKLKSVEVRDQLTQQTFKVKARHFVSTVGPWTDILASDLLKDWKKIMRPTKGIHLTFSKNRIPLNEAVVMMSDDEKRIVFGIPRLEMVIVGTTDTDFPGDPASVKSDREDVDYLLHVINNYFPGAKIEESDILASYSGIRPLVNDGSGSESKTSREHLILSDPRNITFLSGGKYTTYRSMAEETVDVVLEQFTVEEQISWSKSSTISPLNPKASLMGMRKAMAELDRLSAKYNMTTQDLEFLIDRHGEEAAEILETYLRKLRRNDSLVWCLEAYQAIHQTMCLNLIDFYLRRVHLFLAEPDHGRRFVQDIAEVFRKELSWSDQELKNQIESLEKHQSVEMAWQK